MRRAYPDLDIKSMRQSGKGKGNVGLLWHPLPGLSMELYRGVPLVDLHSTGDSLQDRGLHYALVYRRAVQP